MKRDVDLMRQLLLISADGSGRANRVDKGSETWGHLELLCDAGMLAWSARHYSITELGRQFAMRLADETMWERLKSATNGFAGLTFDMIEEIYAATAGSGAVPEREVNPDAWLSGLQVNAETMLLVAMRLAGELQAFGLASGIAQASVEDHLPLVHDVISNHLGDLIAVGPVVASGATGLSVRVGFVPEGYRRCAEAAKDRLNVAHSDIPTKEGEK